MKVRFIRISLDLCIVGFDSGLVMILSLLLSLHPLCGGRDLLFLLCPPAAATT